MTKKNKNRILAFLLPLFLLTSCHSENGKPSIFVYDKEDTFILSLTEKIQKKLTEEKIGYVTYDSNRSQTKQNKDIVEAIDNKNTPLLFVNLVDRLSAYTTMEKATKAHVPVIFYNREPLTGDMEKILKINNDIYYVGTNPTSEGEKQAEMTAEIFQSPAKLNPLYDKNGDNKIQAILLKGEIGNQDTENRNLSFLNGIKRRGYQIEVLDSVYCDWKRKEGYESMKTLYQKYQGRIELVVSNNDDMALGAIDALSELNVFDKETGSHPFEVLGVDGIDEAIPYIENGLLYGTVKNDDERQADAVVSLGKKLLEKETIDETFPYTINSSHAIYLEGNIITKDTLNKEN